MWFLCTLPSDVGMRQNPDVIIHTQCLGAKTEAQGPVGNGMSLYGHDSNKSERLIDWCSRALSTDLHGIWTSREDDFVILTPLDTVSQRIMPPQQHQPFLSVAFFGAKRILHILLSSMAAS